MSVEDLCVKIAETPRELAYCAGIQALVFAVEQNVDLDVVFDGYEGDRRWYLLMTSEGLPVGVTAWRRIEPNTIKIERIALLKEGRGKGYGSKIVSFVMDDIRKQDGIQKMMLSGQDRVMSFYEKLGFKVVGDGYIEGGMPHHKMEMDKRKEKRYECRSESNRNDG